MALRLRTSMARLYRHSTSAWRRLPDFIIIGAQKSGTSSLYHYLAQHPDIVMSVQKEIHYYNYYRLKGKGLRWYRSFFPLTIRSRNKLTGEASPYYLFDENVPPRIKKDLPDVKLIALLRNPIDRAYSAYNMNKRQQGTADYPTFEEAIANPDMSLEQSRLYLFRGRYAEHIQHWLQHFRRDQMLFIRSEEFFGNPGKVLDDVFDFLGVSRVYPEDVQAQEVGSYSELSPKSRSELDVYFEDVNRELVELLGDRFRW